MKKTPVFAAFVLLFAAIISGCGTPVLPPGNLSAEGTQDEIALQWAASTDPGLSAYRIYRSLNGETPVQIGAVGAGITEYADAGVPAGEFAEYQVKAVAGTKESDPTNTVLNVRGTRITSQGGDFTTVVGSSPYVVDGNIGIGGQLIVDQNTKLCVLPGVTITFTNSLPKRLYVYRGTLAVRGTADAPVTITGSGGGVDLNIGSAAAGTSLEYVQFSKLASTSGTSICASVGACSPVFLYCRFEAKNLSSMWRINNDDTNPTGIVFDHCFFKDFALNIQFGVAENLSIDSCMFLGGTPAISFTNFYADDRLPQSGQFYHNVFQVNGTANSPYYLADINVSYCATVGTVPLSGNYFYRSEPNVALTHASDFYVCLDHATTALSFSGLLTARPTDAGPGWGILPF